jgi:TetR/AcrR family transcriptional repressor of lmrAB and yxaGH operons
MIKRQDLGTGLDRIADAFRTYGYDGASMSILSRETGWGRASLYHHFPGGKREMAERALTHVGGHAQVQVLDSLRGPASPAVKLKRFSRALSKFYRQGRMNCLLGTMVLSGGMLACAEGLKQSMNDWLRALAEVLADAGYSRADSARRSEEALALIQGALILSRCLQSEEPFMRAIRDLPHNLLAGRPELPGSTR